MPVPPQFKRAAKKRLDQALPSNTSSKTKKGGVATFKRPGNKAGSGLMQQGQGNGMPNKDAGQPSALGMLAAMASSKKKKNKVQPAAQRKVMAMRLAAKK